MPGACAIEMIRISSLMLDDISFMYNTESLSGKQSNHRVFGYKTTINLLKTAALIKRSVVIGAILGGGNEEQIAKLRNFGGCIGPRLVCLKDMADKKETAYPKMIGVQRGKEFDPGFNREAQELLAMYGHHKAAPFIALAEYIPYKAFYFIN